MKKILKYTCCMKKIILYNMQDNLREYYVGEELIREERILIKDTRKG